MLGNAPTLAIRGVDTAKNEPPKVLTRKHKSLTGDTDNLFDQFTREKIQVFPNEVRRFREAILRQR